MCPETKESTEMQRSSKKTDRAVFFKVNGYSWEFIPEDTGKVRAVCKELGLNEISSSRSSALQLAMDKSCK